MRNAENFSIINSKGLKLSIAIDQPKLEKSPVVLILHGFTGYKEEEHLDDIAKTLCNAGITAIRFDTAGSGFSEGSTEEDFRVSGYLKDINTVIDWIFSLALIDHQRFGITGHSLGGGLSLIQSAIDLRMKACFAIQPSKVKMDQRSIYDTSQWEQTGYFEKISAHPKRKIFRLPWEFALDRNSFDAVEYSEKISVPVEILYGTADSVIPPEVSIELYHALATREKNLIALENYGHDFKKNREQRRHVSELAKQFFLKHLTLSSPSL